MGVIGAGYVGLVTAACLAHLGNRVMVVEQSRETIALLRQGLVPYYEPGLSDLVAQGVSAHLLSFSQDYRDVSQARIVYIAVGSPELPDGSADLTYVFGCLQSLATTQQNCYRIIAVKSTVPIGTGDSAVRYLAGLGLEEGRDFDLVSCPEFLREGSAISDFLRPARTVIGTESDIAQKSLRDALAPLGSPVVVTSRRNAEAIKHFSNAYLAAKISFANEMANICELFQADVRTVAHGMGLDPRIGPHYLGAGVGYGGPCFPKDIRALIFAAQSRGYHAPLLRAVESVNTSQVRSVARRLTLLLGADLQGLTVSVLGLTFKPDTDDLRNAPSLSIIADIKAAGANVRAYDPRVRPGTVGLPVEISPDAIACLRGSDAAVIVTEWAEFIDLDWRTVLSVMRTPAILDGRDCLDPDAMTSLGFRYAGIGRGGSRPAAAR